MEVVHGQDWVVEGAANMVVFVRESERGDDRLRVLNRLVAARLGREMTWLEGDTHTCLDGRRVGGLVVSPMFFAIAMHAYKRMTARLLRVRLVLLAVLRAAAALPPPLPGEERPVIDRIGGGPIEQLVGDLIAAPAAPPRRGVELVAI